jgi:glycosyltransferase involved in cell wall biosynthesis
MAGPDQSGLKSKLIAQAAKAGIADRVHWPGMVAGDAKWGAFRAAEAFVLPSHQENFGIVVAEAMACKTPVLLTDKVNIWREVQMSGGGLVGPDTSEGIESLLRSWLSLSRRQQKRHARRCPRGLRTAFPHRGGGPRSHHHFALHLSTRPS